MTNDAGTLFAVNHPQALFLAAMIARSMDGPSTLVLSRHPYLDLIEPAVTAELLGAFTEVIALEFVDFKIAWRQLPEAFAMRRRIRSLAPLAERPFARLVVFNDVYPAHAFLLDHVRAAEVTVLGESAATVGGRRHTTLRGWLTFAYANACTLFLARYVLDARSNEAGLLVLSSLRRPRARYALSSAYHHALVQRAMGAVRAGRRAPERGIALVIGSPQLASYYPELGTPESQRRLVRAMIAHAEAQGQEVVYIQHPREGTEHVGDAVPASRVIKPGLGEHYIERNRDQIAIAYGFSSTLMIFSSLIGIPTYSYAPLLGLTPAHLAFWKNFLASGAIHYVEHESGPPAQACRRE